MGKPFVLRDIFPDEITLLILEYYLHDQDLFSEWREIQAGSQLDVDDYWIGVESITGVLIPGLLSSESSMRDTLRSIFLRVNVIPHQLRFYCFNNGNYYDRIVLLEPALKKWPTGYQHVRSLALEGQDEVLSKDLLRACPNLVHLRIGCLQNLWGPMVHRWHYSIPRQLFSGDETTLSEEKSTIELHVYPKLEHIELMAESSFWPENVIRNIGFLDALRVIVIEILVGFIRQRRHIKLEIIKRDNSHKRGESFGWFRVDERTLQEVPKGESVGASQLPA